MNPGTMTIPKRRVLGLDISLGTFQWHVDTIVGMGTARISSYVCCVNAHMTVECHRDPDFSKVVREADLATADGVPVLRTMQWFHGTGQDRVAGNDLMPAILKAAEDRGASVFLVGGAEEVQERIVERIRTELPGLGIAGRHVPPYVPIGSMDLERQAAMIEGAKANIVLVSLGCPKQEKWMAAMKGRINAVMIGVGGAFLLYAGLDTRAPKWMRDMSLEWLYRLCLEPRRLWKRYLVTNLIFLGIFLRAALRRSMGKAE